MVPAVDIELAANPQATSERSDSELYYSQAGIDIYLADARKKLALLEAKSFQTCVTSPPYWGLRDYDYENQIGAEDQVEDYIKDLVSLFGSVRRTLRDDGTLWLNIGDAY